LLFFVFVVEKPRRNDCFTKRDDDDDDAKATVMIALTNPNNNKCAFINKVARGGLPYLNARQFFCDVLRSR